MSLFPNSLWLALIQSQKLLLRTFMSLHFNYANSSNEVYFSHFTFHKRSPTISHFEYLLLQGKVVDKMLYV